MIKKIKQAVKLLAFIGLIVLAGIGIGISGGVPIPLSKNRRDTRKDPFELVDKENDQSATDQSQFKG